MDIISLFHDKKLYKQAVTLSHNGKPSAYERLEFLGDRVLGVIVADMLYRAFPKEREGALAKRFVFMVREETLAHVATKWGIPDQLITSEHELRHNQSVLADVCEAILGAMYLDQGLEAVRAFMTPFWQPLLQTDLISLKDNKSTLQEWAQKHKYDLPVYTVLSRTGPQHAPHFLVQVEIIGIGAETGEGSSIKAAELQAAQRLCHTIQKHNTTHS
ncbi:MAG: ribonuclease III [Alphaproteobacteria bacterium]